MISDVINEVSKARSKKQKVKILQNSETWALKDILRGTYDESVKWNIPNGRPPYKENQGYNAPSNEIKKHKEFSSVVQGQSGDAMRKIRREQLFITLLESVPPPESELVIDMINKIPIKGVTKAVVKEAFPDLIQK